MTDEEFLREVFLHCICTGDQDLWNIVYPRCQEKGFVIDENIIKHFAMNIGEFGK